ncbi:MAG: CYTH domain-containing protein, partial [Alistipes sp.]|nr:CYTH domain-containing protein [Alistipes sp.]
MAQEIERKFLVAGDYKPHASSSSHIVQGYISSDAGRTVRVRLRDDRAFLTIKGPSADGGISRFEWETEIPSRDALQLLTLAQGPLIDKRRYLVEVGSNTFDVDEFYGYNYGLTLAEV